MKRIILFLLGIMLLCGCVHAAAAEESLPYLEMFQNNVAYKRYVLLTAETCPMVCISPYSATRQYDWTNTVEPVFVVFPNPPADSYCRSFSVHSAAYEDLQGERRIDYGFRSSYWTAEKFLASVTDPGMIIMDGSNGASAYLTPEWGSAHALAAINGLDTGDSLEITITLKDYSKMDIADRTTLLSGMIREEVARIQAEASVVLLAQFWTDGAYRGIRFFPMENPDIIVTMDMPEMTFHTAGKGEISGKMFITGFSNSGFDCYLVGEPGNAVCLEFTVSTWSVYESDPEDTVSYTFSDGTEWGFCLERDVEGKPRQAYGSCIISQDDKKTVYLTVRASTSSDDSLWPDMTVFTGDIETMMKSVSVSGGTNGCYAEKSAAQHPAGWQKTDGKWYWYKADGTAATGWLEVDGKWYWLGADGAMATGWQKLNNGGTVAWSYFTPGDNGSMVTGWQEIDGKKYYFDADGAMATGWQKLDNGGTAAWSYFTPGDNGSMVTGWQEIDGKKYYFDADGRMQTGWQKLNNGGTAAWSYFTPGDNGSMVTGWQEIDGKKYYFDADGRMQTGWQKLDNGGTAAWSYFKPGDNGSMVTGWQEIDGKEYYFDDNGRMQTGWQKIGDKWYWFGSDGAMVTGWQQIDGKRYWFYTNGRMATGWWKIDGEWYYFDDNGQTMKGWKKIGTGWFYFQDNGTITIGWIEDGGDKYYLDKYGVMVTGWQEIDGVWYYFHGNGKMETLIRPIASGNAEAGDGRQYYIFPGSICKSMGFAPKDALDASGAAWFSVIILTDYSSAEEETPDTGKLFDPNTLVHGALAGADGASVNLLVISEETSQALFMFYDTQSNNVFSFFEDQIDSERAENAFAVLCQDGYARIEEESIYSVYAYILGSKDSE